MDYNDIAVNWEAMQKYTPAPRHRRRLIINLMKGISFQSVLDIGCGKGLMLNQIKKIFRVPLTGCDISEKAIYENQINFPEINFHQLDISKDFLSEKFDVEDRVRILGEDYRELINDTDPYRVFNKYYKEAKELDWLDRHLYVDSMTWLPDDILVKVDRTSMQSSIEARAPYLDVNLAEYAASIPSGLKLKGNETKYILKKALADILPNATLYKKKSGFNAPIGNWIDNGELDEFKTFNKFVLQRKIKDAKKTA